MVIGEAVTKVVVAPPGVPGAPAATTAATVDQAWSLTQFHHVGFSQPRSNYPVTSAPSLTPDCDLHSSFSVLPDARGEVGGP